MRLIKVKNYDDMSQLGASFVLGRIMNSDRQNIAITAGNTPKKMYEIIAPIIKDNEAFKNVHYFNFDEVPFEEDGIEGITLTDLYKLYYNPASIGEDRIHKLHVQNYKTWDSYLEDQGGLDLIVMGLGADGHFCGNMPNATTINDYTVPVHLDDDIRSHFAKMFNKPIEEVPTYFVTMGPRSVLKAKELLLVVNGKEKAEALKKVLQEDIDPNYPATMLTLHPNLTIIADEEALSLIK